MPHAARCTHIDILRMVALISALSGAPSAWAAAPMSISDWAQSAVQELSAAELARERALVPDIKRLAAQIAQDYGTALAQLRELGLRKGWTDTLHVDTLPAYARRWGPAFDRGYMQNVVQSHLQALTAIRSAQHDSDPDVRRLATNLESLLEAHLARAREIGWRLERFGIDTGMKEQLIEARNAEERVQ